MFVVVLLIVSIFCIRRYPILLSFFKKIIIMGNIECHLLRHALEVAFDHETCPSENLYQRLELDLIVWLYVERIPVNQTSTYVPISAEPAPSSSVLATVDLAPLTSTPPSPGAVSNRYRSNSPLYAANRGFRHRCSYCKRIGHLYEDCNTRFTASGLWFVCGASDHLSFTCKHLLMLRSQLSESAHDSSSDTGTVNPPINAS